MILYPYVFSFITRIFLYLLIFVAHYILVVSNVRYLCKHYSDERLTLVSFSSAAACDANECERSHRSVRTARAALALSLFLSFSLFVSCFLVSYTTCLILCISCHLSSAYAGRNTYLGTHGKLDLTGAFVMDLTGPQVAIIV